ncbi:hypothetical protein Vafri_7023 [Volvox africanus]|uniref:Uncharacterized protein n=1 Tax=Volvox africanus TaxID=51714 RepID=A0A8J4EYS3_9CHLO|nr:hypothetical protein Vafri_7023 [Volvox africanus]
MTDGCGKTAVTPMDALYKFAYAPPNRKLAKRLAQMAELGGYESSPIHIASMASYALLLGTITCTRSLEVCEDGEAVRVVHGRGQSGHNATNKATESSDRTQQVAPVCRLTHAIMGDTPGAASFLAEGPLRTWLSDGCHTSLVCFGLSSTTRLTTRSSCNTSPDGATPPPGAMPTSQSASFIWPTVAVTAAIPAPTPVEVALPAALEVLLGLERPSALLECLHAAFSGRTGASGVALWCFELHEANDSSPTNSSDSIGDNDDDPGGGSSHRASRDATWRRDVAAATRPGGGGNGGGGSRWRDLMAEAVAETVAQAAQGSAATFAASVGGGGARASAGGTGGCKARGQGRIRGSVGAAATPIDSVDGLVHAASVAEAIAALHAAFSRSSLWRRRDPSRHRPSPATVAAPGPLLEPATRLGGSTAAQIFVRLGVRLPPQTEKMHHHYHQQQGGAANGSGSAARGEAAQRVWTTLDLVFIGCDPPPPQQQPGTATTEDLYEGTGGLSSGSGPSGSAADGGGAGLALGRVRELLTELVARQDGETGIPRPLRCTSRPQSSGLCLRLAHLLAGNVAPHLLLVLPASLPDAEANPEDGQYVLDTLELFSRARAIRTVVTKSEPPPPLYGASLAESLASSSPRDSDRQVASLMRLRHSQEMKDVVRACRRGAATDPGTPATGGEVAPLDSDAASSTAAAADSTRTSISGISLCAIAAASAGGNDGDLALPRMQYRDRTDILGRMDLRLIVATSSQAASALPASSGAVALDSGWAADPRRDKPERSSAWGTDGRSSGGPQDGDGDHTGTHLRSTDLAGGPRQLQQQLDANTRHGLVGLTSSQTMPLQPATHLCGGGGGSSNGKSGPPAYAGGGATRRAGAQQQTEAKGAGSLAGGLLRLQRRLESLQNARILRESAATATATATAAKAKAGRYVPASGAASHGSSSGGGGDDSDSSRNVSARGTGIGTDGCLYGSGPSSDRVAGAAVLLQPHASSPSVHSTMLSRSQLGSCDVRQEQQQYPHKSQQQEQQQQHETTVWQQPLRHPVLSQPQAALTRQVAPVAVAASVANTAMMASAAASPSAASAAALAEERLARLRSEFDQLYEGLFSKGLQDSPSAADAAADAATAADGGGHDVPHLAPQPVQPSAPRPLSASQQFQPPSVLQPCRAVGTETAAAAVAEPPAACPPRSGQPATTDQMQSPRSQTSRFLGTEPASSALESYGRGSRDLAPASDWGGAAQTMALVSASSAKPKATYHNAVGGSSGGALIGPAHNFRSDGGGSGSVTANWLNASVSGSIGAGGGGGGGSGGSVKLTPSSDKAGDRRRPSVAAACRAPSARSPRHSSEAAWAALPHGGPAQGLYGALLAGYAAQELVKSVAGTQPKSRSARGAGSGGVNPHSDKIAGGGISQTDTGEPDWHRLRELSSGVFLKSGAAAARVAPAAAAPTPINGHDSGGTGAEAVSIILSSSNNTAGLEHLLDSSSNSSGASGGAQEAVREEDSDGSAAFGALSGALTMAAAGATGLEDPAWGQSVLLADVKAVDLKEGGVGGSGELLAAWPSAGATKFRSRSGTIGSLDVPCSGGAGGVLSSEGSGDDASLGSWNLRIAQDAMSIAAALSSPSSQQPSPTAPLPLPGRAASTPTGLVAENPGLSPSRLGSRSSTADAAVWPAVNMDATVATSQAVSVAAAAAAAAAAAVPCSGGGAPLPQVESCRTRPDTARPSVVAALEATLASASEVPNSGTVPLRQRNQALLGALERAAAGSEVLQERLYDTQLELMELRTLMEVQQATHDEEVVRLRRHLRRAAVAEAEAEGTSVLAVAPTGTGGKCGDRLLAAAEAAAASAAMTELMAAYEEDIDGLRRQVADLIAGQRDLAILCAEQDLAALAMDAVRSRRSHLHQHHLPDQHAVGAAVTAAASTDDGGVASSAHPASSQAAAPSARGVARASNSTADGSGGAAGAVADALTTPRSKASVSPSRGRLLAAAPSPSSSSSPPSGLQQRRRRQHQLTAEQFQSQTCLRSRSDGPTRGESRRRRHSCGPHMGGASSPFRSGVAAAAGPAPPRSRSRLGASADTAYTCQCRHRYPDGADSDASVEGFGGHNGGSSGLEGEAGRGWWFLSDTARRGSTLGGVWPGDAEVTWRRGQKEMGALRSALRQAHRREAQLRTALAAAQQQRRAALLQARLAAGEGARRRWLETQAADLANQLTSARADATAAAASRDAAVRDAQQLLAENQVLTVQLDGMRRLAESFAQLAGRAHDLETNLDPGRGRDPDPVAPGWLQTAVA